MLTHYFTAFYNDGSYFNQDKDDRSLVDPLRSSYFDVDQNKLIAFALSDRETTYKVDLKTGLFTQDNLPLLYPRDHPPVELLTPLRLIYFRRNTISQPFQHTVVFHLGWQANDVEGGNIQTVLEID